MDEPNPNPNPNFRPSPHHHPQPKQVRGFVWKAIAAARATPGFRENGLYQTLALRDDVNEADRVQTNPNPNPNPNPTLSLSLTLTLTRPTACRSIRTYRAR